ncbi:stage V sporulation protein AC [Caloramator mitchellensis]|nr:stage V sporulation protein AC [Caloramator mitchellensis]
MVQKTIPQSSILKDVIFAFVVGGLICDVGQLVMNIFLSMGIPRDEVGSYVASIMVFLGAFLTGLGVYDNIGKYAGAGSIVPITGFANSIVSPAMEYKREGYIFGVGAKMFVIAGPILVYGISSSIIVGIIYFLVKMFVR